MFLVLTIFGAVINAVKLILAAFGFLVLVFVLGTLLAIVVR